MSILNKTDQEIEKLAFEFSKAESYGKLNSYLWKGFYFGFKKAQKIHKERINKIK